MRTSLLLIFSFLALNLVFAQKPALPKAVYQKYKAALFTARQNNHAEALKDVKMLLQDPSVPPIWRERLTADTLFFHGVIDYEKRIMRSAEQYLKESLVAREALFGQNDSSVAESCSRLGMLYRRTGAYADSKTYMQRALDIQKIVLGPDNVLVAYSFNNLGNLYKSMNEPEKAIQNYEEAISIYKTLEKDSIRLSGEGMAYLNYAILNHRLGEYGLAERQVLKGLRIYKDIYGKHHKELGRFWFELARLAIDQSDFSQSLVYADSASKAWQGHGVPENLYIKIIQGIAHAERGDYEQAEEYQLLVLSEMRAKGVGNPMAIAGIYSNLANIALLQNHFEESEAYLDESMKLEANLLPPGDPILKKNYYLLGQISHQSGKLDQAITYYEKSLIKVNGKRLDEIPENGASFETLGALYCLKKQFDLAFEQFEMAKNCFEESDLIQHADYARLHEKIAIAYSQNQQFDEAKKAMQKGREILGYDFEIENTTVLPRLRSPYSRNALLENLQASANIYLAQSKESKAENQYAWQSLQLAIALIDSMRLSFRSHGAKALLHDKIFPVYDAAIKLAWQNYQDQQDPYWIEQAFMMSERNKSMILFESLRDHQAQKFGGIPDSVLQLERRISLDLALIEKQLFELENANKEVQNKVRSQLLELRATYDDFISRLENDYPAYFNLKYAPSTVSTSDVQAQLYASDQAWISYFVGELKTYAFVIRANQIDWIEVGDSKTLTQHIQALNQAILEEYKNEETQLADVSYQLYKLLVAPLGDLPADLVVIPDGILGYVPFDLLLTQASDEQNGFKDWSYLLHRHQISYAYSGTLHLQQIQQKNRLKLRTKVLAFAPSFPQIDQGQFASSRRQLSPLAHNQSEVNQLAKYFSANTYLASAASEAEFKQRASTYDIIHIASHALVNDQNPLYSHISFTPGVDSLEDGVLELAELFNLRLQAEMVVLSACETGLGKLQRGEGIVSLARGMSYAGANSVLTTLWQVNDAATADLMERFYAALDQGMTKDAALRNAKIDYLAASDQLSAHPFFWAAYVPIGDMRPIKSTNWFSIFLLSGLGISLLIGVYWIRKRK